MPKFITFQRENKDIISLKEVHSDQNATRNRLEVINLRLTDCFREDGSITPAGLAVELIDLDERRRAPDVDPTDAKTQLLIQGQQNEIIKLSEMHKTLLDEREKLAQKLSELEKRAVELNEKINRRTGNG